MTEDTALKISCGLGGGMGRNQQVCGAVSGGILVLGLRHGRGSRDERAATEFTYKKTRDLMDAFTGRHGSCICRELLEGHDLSTPEGFERFKMSGLHETVCKEAVRTIAELLEKRG